GSMGSCTAMPGNTTMSSSGTSLRDAMALTLRSIVDDVNYCLHQLQWPGMKRGKADACGAWELLLELMLSQRGQLPVLAAALELSPAQCHVLHLIQPGNPVPMKQLAITLSCDASNVTG